MSLSRSICIITFYTSYWQWLSQWKLFCCRTLSFTYGCITESKHLLYFPKRISALIHSNSIGVWGCPRYGDVIMAAIASQITSLTIVYSTVYLDADQRKHQSSASLAFVRGIHRGPVNSPHKWPVTRKIFPFDDVTMLSSQWLNMSQCLSHMNSVRLDSTNWFNFANHLRAFYFSVIVFKTHSQKLISKAYFHMHIWNNNAILWFLIVTFKRGLRDTCLITYGRQICHPRMRGTTMMYLLATFLQDGDDLVEYNFKIFSWQKQSDLWRNALWLLSYKVILVKVFIG